jgi:hypothetical protein
MTDPCIERLMQISDADCVRMCFKDVTVHGSESLGFLEKIR